MDSNYKIALAALIHDIGKVIQRTSRKHNLKGHESIFCKFDKSNNRYGYFHSLYTVRFIEDYLSDILDEEYLQISAKHHVADTILENIVARADRLSAGMDRNKYPNDVNQYNYKNARLYSVFNNIRDIKPHAQYSNSHFYYDLIPLQITNEIFPKEDKGIKRKIKASEEAYEKLFKKIEEEMKKIEKRDIEKTYNQIHNILEKYTSFVPSSTIDYPDISLYDHLRTTAAITTCIYEVYKSKEKPKKEFLLLEADVSGIQKFIYQITEGEETKKNIAKSLRGRSAYVNILIDFFSKYIVKSLGLTISNILYCGGGKFQLLLPNTLNIKEKIKEIEKKLEVYLYRCYKGRIGIVLDYIAVDEEGIKDYGSSMSLLRGKVEEAKNRKFVHVIHEKEDMFFVSKRRFKKVCKYCHQHEGNNNGICSECDLHITLGEQLVEGRVKYIVYDFDQKIKGEDAAVAVHFENLGSIYFYEELNYDVDAFMIENINNTGLLGRIKFIGNIVPKDKGKENAIASFNDLAAIAEGDKKIAVLKMDIDNLGMIFSNGLNKKNRSISRISTLSRMIELFFSGYINKLCKDLYDDYINKYGDIYLKDIFYINYSGGDDLLIIGPWDWTIKLALEIRKKLEEYVCQNQNITISAGIYICDSKEPIRISSEEAEKHLEKAKQKEGKDVVCIFNNVFSWFGKNSLEKSLEESTIYKKLLEENKISRGLIYNIMLASKNIDLREKRPQDYDLMPKLVYALSRNIKDTEVCKTLSSKLITAKLEDSELPFVQYPLMFTLMKTRE